MAKYRSLPALLAACFLVSTSTSLASNYFSGRPAAFVVPAKATCTQQDDEVAAGTTTSTIAPTTFPRSTRLWVQSKRKLQGRKGKKRVPVKLLETIEGTGKPGDFVSVSQPYYNYKLKPSNMAVRVTEEEMELEVKRMEQEQEERERIARQWQGYLLDSKPLLLAHKAGPKGRLFGSVTTKMILSELQSQTIEPKQTTDGWDYPSDIRIANLFDHTGSTLVGDIKYVGRYTVEVSFGNGIAAQAAIEIQTEDKR